MNMEIELNIFYKIIYNNFTKLYLILQNYKLINYKLIN